MWMNRVNLSREKGNFVLLIKSWGCDQFYLMNELVHILLRLCLFVLYVILINFHPYYVWVGGACRFTLADIPSHVVIFQFIWIWIINLVPIYYSLSIIVLIVSMYVFILLYFHLYVCVTYWVYFLYHRDAQMIRKWMIFW